MLNRLFTVRKFILFLVLAGASLSWSTSSEAAQEQRCEQLGANCLCSIKFDVAGWQTGSPNWTVQATNALDGNDKPCWNQSGRHAIQFNAGTSRIQQFTSGGLKNLPFTRSSDPGCCLAVNIGNGYSLIPNHPTPSGMVGARYYFRMSTDYTSTGQGGCTNDKQIQLGNPYMTAQSNLFQDNGGPAGVPGGGQWGTRSITVNSLKGKWAMIEMYNNFNTGLKRYCIRNVTDGGQEECWSNTLPGNSSNGELFNAIHRYRADNCAGHVDVMYVLAARWSNPSGSERIGPAPELEGSGTSSNNLTPPPAPTGLTVAQ
jgi:hypothetical protein